MTDSSKTVPPQVDEDLDNRDLDNRDLDAQGLDNQDFNDQDFGSWQAPGAEERAQLGELARTIGPTDSIFALSSAPGRAGVAVVRLSGPDAGAVLRRLCGGKLPVPRRAQLTKLCDPLDGAEIDQGLVLWFPAPHSFTGEDCAELQLHGSRAVLARLFALLPRLGRLRPAEPGEFTRRAFGNGRMDLTEVEGLADLIDADTEAQRQQALRQMEGALSQQITTWMAQLTQDLAYLEAAIDFADEELPEDLLQQALTRLAGLAEEISRHVVQSAIGERLRDGIRVAILGPPNAGKSSLLNLLARRDAAIVSETAGTTRDVIEVQLDLGGYPVVLADTAGLRDRRLDNLDPVEREGMRRTLQQVARADLKIILFDAGDWPDLDGETLSLIDARCLVVLSKIDRHAAPADRQLAGRPISLLSLTSGQGVEAFLETLRREVAARYDLAREAPLFTRDRHRQALAEVVAHLHDLPQAVDIALMAESLRLAVRALGRILGQVDVEDLLDVIFRDFCIGK